MSKTIHREMTIEQILNNFPQKAQRLAQELNRAGLNCVGCGAATWETLEAAILAHGLPPEKLELLEERLNAILEEESDLATITLTPRAASKFQSLCQEEDKAGWGMRFTEQLSGCNGFEYDLDYSKKSLSDDTIFVSEGIEIHVKTILVERLIGCVIDYIDGLTNGGFKVTNPNVQTSCHCGSSHGY